MKNWIMRWVASALALFIVTKIGIGVTADNLTAVLIATVVFGLFNSLIRPVLVLLTLPLNCMTFGLFGLVLNAILFFVVGNAVNGFHVESALGAVLGPIVMGIISGILSNFLQDSDR